MGNYSDGSTQDLTGTVTWSSSHPSVAGIDSAGLATAVGDGTTNITAANDSLNGSTMLIVQSGTPDPLGTATASQTTCTAGGVTATTCYSLAISCPGVADTNALVKVTSPAGTPLGTVIFIPGGGGNGFYDQSYTYSTMVTDTVVKAGYTAVQISFTDPNQGWLTGPGGPRRLACRFATATRWIYDKVHKGGATQPLCAHGESGGATAIGYALSHYGMASFFSMVELASGPPLARLDHGCLCDQSAIAGPCGATSLSTCYDTGTKTFVDVTYGAPLCSQAAGNASNPAALLSDSILSGSGSLLSFPNTDVHLLFGGMDLSSSPAEGKEWGDALTSKKTYLCVADAAHDVNDYQDAAQQIANDLVAFCKLQ